MSTAYTVDLFVTGVETMRREDKPYFFARIKHVNIETILVLQAIYKGYGVVSRTPGGIVLHRIFSRPRINGP